jgi:hypothetical protein
MKRSSDERRSRVSEAAGRAGSGAFQVFNFGDKGGTGVWGGGVVAADSPVGLFFFVTPFARASAAAVTALSTAPGDGRPP